MQEGEHAPLPSFYVGISRSTDYCTVPTARVGDRSYLGSLDGAVGYEGDLPPYLASSLA